jgi:hypothetical protein
MVPNSLFELFLSIYSPSVTQKCITMLEMPQFIFSPAEKKVPSFPFLEKKVTLYPLSPPNISVPPYPPNIPYVFSSFSSSSLSSFFLFFFVLILLLVLSFFLSCLRRLN